MTKGQRVAVHYDCKWKSVRGLCSWTLRLANRLTLLSPSAQLTVSTSRVGMGVTGGTPYGWDVGTKAGELRGRRCACALDASC